MAKGIGLEYFHSDQMRMCCRAKRDGELRHPSVLLHEC